MLRGHSGRHKVRTGGAGGQGASAMLGKTLPVHPEHSAAFTLVALRESLWAMPWPFRSMERSKERNAWPRSLHNHGCHGSPTALAFGSCKCQSVCAFWLLLGDDLKAELSCAPQSTLALDSSWMSLGCAVLSHVLCCLVGKNSLSEAEEWVFLTDSGLLPGSSPRRAHLVPSHQSSWITSLNQTDILEAIIGLIFSRSRRW